MIHFVPILGTGESLFSVSEKSHHRKQQQKRSPETKEEVRALWRLSARTWYPVSPGPGDYKAASTMAKVKPAITKTPLMLSLQITQFL